VVIPDPTVAAGLARRLAEFAVSKGAIPEALFRRSEIDRSDLLDQDNRIPFAKFAKLMRSAKELTRDPAFALHFGAAIDMMEYSMLGLLLQASETIEQGAAHYNRYGRLLAEVDADEAGRMQVHRRDGRLWVVDTRRDPNDFPELTEMIIVGLVGMSRRFAQTALVKEVHFTHRAPPYRDDYERLCRGPVVFESEWNAVGVDEAQLCNRLGATPKYLLALLTERADELLGKLESSKSMRGRVESMIMPMLHTGQTRVDAIADKFGYSRATLYRKLKEEGVTFEHVVDQLRYRLALHYLNVRKLTVQEVAYLVGFSDPTAFSRAFRRWTGSAPRSR
jgi:AraC-like DNA-binding protein